MVTISPRNSSFRVSSQFAKQSPSSCSRLTICETWPSRVGQISGLLRAGRRRTEALAEALEDPAQQPAVHGDDLASDVGPGVRAQVGDEVAEVGGHPDPAQRDLAPGRESGVAISICDTERIRRLGRDSLADDYTIDDPKAYTKPWTVEKLYTLKPSWQIKEYVCAENNLTH